MHLAYLQKSGLKQTRNKPKVRNKELQESKNFKSYSRANYCSLQQKLKKK